MTPDFSVIADGVDVTGRFGGRKIEIEVVDATGVESDSAEITIFDPEAIVSPPRKGAILAISLGYRETGLIPQGLFKVDKVIFKGYPHQIVIQARSADNKKEMKERRTRDYTNKTLQQVAQEIAARHGMPALVASDLASLKFPVFAGADESYIGQHEESDVSFLTRVAEERGGFFSPKNGRFLIAKRGDGKNMSGAVGNVVITPDVLIDKDAYETFEQDKPVHGKVEASYFDRGKVKRVPVQEGGEEDGIVYRFRNPFPSEKQARDAAKGKVRELQRAGGSAKFTRWGDATIRAEMNLTAIGIRDGVDGVWTIARVSHRIDDRGFISKIECETKPKGGAS